VLRPRSPLRCLPHSRWPCPRASLPLLPRCRTLLCPLLSRPRHLLPSLRLARQASPVLRQPCRIPRCPQLSPRPCLQLSRVTSPARNRLLRSRLLGPLSSLRPSQALSLPFKTRHFRPTSQLRCRQVSPVRSQVHYQHLLFRRLNLRPCRQASPLLFRQPRTLPYLLRNRVSDQALLPVPRPRPGPPPYPQVSRLPPRRNRPLFLPCSHRRCPLASLLRVPVSSPLAGLRSSRAPSRRRRRLCAPAVTRPVSQVRRPAHSQVSRQVRNQPAGLSPSPPLSQAPNLLQSPVVSPLASPAASLPAVQWQSPLQSPLVRPRHSRVVSPRVSPAALRRDSRLQGPH